MVKNTFKTILILMIAYLVLPTGPSDIFIIPFIVGLIGATGYLILSIFLIVYIYKIMDGKDLVSKLKNVTKELEGLLE